MIPIEPSFFNFLAFFKTLYAAKQHLGVESLRLGAFHFRILHFDRLERRLRINVFDFFSLNAKKEFRLSEQLFRLKFGDE